MFGHLSGANMLIRVISFFLCLSLFSISAGAATPGLKAAFDELNYSLTVEWDQKDPGFYDSHIEKFNSILKVSSKPEIVEFIKSALKNEKLAHEFATAMEQIKIQKMSALDAETLLRTMVEKSYQSGASWSGDRDVPPVLTVMLVV